MVVRGFSAWLKKWTEAAIVTELVHIFIVS
ncbi:uncharacterized protein METZ01_LOCUS198144 [marine metagenome]|uniref:Uncharacterized protein n=1 Tax=marine metagenome TaxID=408172 RepID=A0A382E3N6_9ZZZZ